jgi:hypothetical protein
MLAAASGSAMMLCLPASTAAPSHHRHHHAMPAARVGFWSGQTPTTYSPALWRVLKHTHGVLYLDVTYTSDFGPGAPKKPAVLAVIRRANRLGVRIQPWVLVPASHGTFADEQNAPFMRRAIVSFIRWAKHRHLVVHRPVLDLEQASGDQQVTDALNGDTSGLKQLMHGNIDLAAQCRSMRTYRGSISWAHRHHQYLDGTPVPFSLDDFLLDHNMGMANGLDFPSYVPHMYDRLYLQAYRAEFGFDFGSAYVARYYRLMHRFFGRDGQITLGNTGHPPYTALGPLITDVRMLAGMGAREIPIFDLASAISTYGIDGVKQVINAGHRPLRGDALQGAEHQWTAQGKGALQLFSKLNDLANKQTAAVTTSEGSPRRPNSWPKGCGAMRPTPHRPKR